MFGGFETGKHGIEGLSNGGEIWGSESSNNTTEDLDTTLFRTKSELIDIKTNFDLANNSGANVDDLASYIMSYGMKLATYRRVIKELALSRGEVWSSTNDSDYLRYKRYYNDMIAVVHEKKVSGPER